MTARKTELNEVEEIERLAGEAEISLVEDSSRHDLKERRKVIKETLYDGSHKLKHIIPKGKHV